MQTPTDDDTLTKINTWASNKYVAASPSLAAASTPTSVAPTGRATSGIDGLLAAAGGPIYTAGSPVTSVNTTPAYTNVSDWYKAATSNTEPATAPATISKGDLTTRIVDPFKETVQGQLGSIMAGDSPLLQQARADGQRSAFDRGLGNSTMAASAGEDSLLRSALQVATPDAATYSRANDYNAAAQNQATMYNADQSNQFALADKNIHAQQVQQAMQLSQQMSLAQMQDQTTRWQQEMQNANSRYNTDSSYRQQIDNQKLGVANNIIQNMDLSPDRKAAMLEQLGFGTMTKPGVPGTGLAGAVYVIDSTSSDLQGQFIHDWYDNVAGNQIDRNGNYYGPDSPGWG